MRPLIAIVLVCFNVIPARAGVQPVVNVEVYSGIYLDLPGDWLIAEGGKVLGAAGALAGKAPPPESASFQRLIYPPPQPGPAVFYLSVTLLPAAEAEVTRQDFEPAQFDKIAPRLAKNVEEGVTAKGGTVKFPTRVKRATISGRPALTTHTVGQKPRDSDSTFDGIYLCAGNALIGITALKSGYAPDAWAPLDRVRASLRLAATVPRAKKPWERAASSTGPSPAQKATDGTVWRLFSALSEDPWQNSWHVFAREVQAMYARTAPREEFIKRFNGKRVVWEGEVGSIEKILREGVRVRFAMPTHTIRLPDGQGYHLDQLMLTLPAGSTITVDKKLRFRATLAGGTDPAVSSVALPGEHFRVITVTSTALAELLQ